MANPWFRMYAEFANDPKVQMLSEAMQRRYMMLMCLHCGNSLVTLHETEIAFALRISDTELADTKSVFVAKGFIDEAWNLLNWEKRQFSSDSSAARVRAHREKKKQACNVTGNDGETKCNALDTDTDTDTEEKKPRKRASAKTSLPENFTVSERVKQWAAEKGQSQLDRHLDHFRLAAKAKGYTYADWDSAFMRAVTDNWAKLAPVAAASKAGGGRREL
jgi:hypothetical protein